MGTSMPDPENARSGVRTDFVIRAARNKLVDIITGALNVAINSDAKCEIAHAAKMVEATEQIARLAQDDGSTQIVIKEAEATAGIARLELDIMRVRLEMEQILMRKFAAILVRDGREILQMSAEEN